MEQASKRIHPLVAGAAASVMLVSLVGVAAITGILPTSHSNNAAPSSAPVAALSAPSATDPSASVVTPAPASATKSVHALDEETADRVTSKPVAKHKPVQHTKVAAATPAPVPAQPTVTSPVAAAPSGAPVYAPPPAPVAQAICHECGRVETVQVVQAAAPTSGLGAVGGAVVGGLLGNQVGGGNGRAIATVAGAIGGGYAGNQIEKRTHSNTYQVRVRMDDGHVRSFPYNNPPQWNAGDRVRVVDGYLTAS